MIPAKLKKGDEIRVISPSRSLAIISKDVLKIANRRFNALGLRVSFSKNSKKIDDFLSSSIKERVDDLHEAFANKNIKAIFTTIGGFNANQILEYLDYDLIKKNPKIFCGYSDITVLSNAIYAKTKLVTYSGPHFSTLGMLNGLDHTLYYLQRCLFGQDKFEIKASEHWSDDAWFINQEKRKFIKNKGFIKINNGKAEGRIVGGNLCTFNLLQGTKFMPSLRDAVLFLEDDEMPKENSAVEFDRNLQSILQTPNANKIKALIIGRFQKASKMTVEKIIKIISTKKELKNIPIIANVDFGHTTPQITFPIGGKARVVVGKDKISLEIIEH